MSKHKPRGKVPSLIGGANGRPKRVTVRRKGECSRCGETLAAGRECVEIPNLRSAQTSKKRVCCGCFQQILQKTAEDLEKIKVDMCL